MLAVSGARDGRRVLERRRACVQWRGVATVYRLKSAKSEYDLQMPSGAISYLRAMTSAVSRKRRNIINKPKYKMATEGKRQNAIARPRSRHNIENRR